jgi:hypothetical protein
VRREINDRKAHGPWRDLIYARLFQPVIVTPTEEKGRQIRDQMTHDTYPHRVVAVPEMTALVFLEKEKRK